MHQDLEKLIATALEDGVLTDKEREILLRKAEKLGEDIDEFEMELESRLSKLNSSKQSNVQNTIVENKVEEVKNTNLNDDEFSLAVFQRKLQEIDDDIINPNRHKNKTDAILGTVKEIFTDVNPLTSFVKSFKDVTGITKQNLQNRKIDLISTFPLPKSKNDLLEMTSLCVSNFETIKSGYWDSTDETDKKLKKAWKSKAEQCISKLRIVAISDGTTMTMVSVFEMKLQKK